MVPIRGGRLYTSLVVLVERCPYCKKRPAKGASTVVHAPRCKFIQEVVMLVRANYAGWRSVWPRMPLCEDEYWETRRMVRRGFFATFGGGRL